ncbi:MAG: hypothetical protein ACOYVK_13585 [Bacillota bacterium]
MEELTKEELDFLYHKDCSARNKEKLSHGIEGNIRIFFSIILILTVAGVVYVH